VHVALLSLLAAAGLPNLPLTAFRQTGTNAQASGNGPSDDICAPVKTIAEPASQLHLAGTKDPSPRLEYGPGDVLVIDGGNASGLQPGQEYLVRRLPMRFGSHRPSAKYPATVHTAGAVRIMTVEPTSATATVIHACDAMLPGDYLEPRVAARDHTGRVAGEVRYDDLATILAGDEDRTIAGSGEFMIIDRGTAHGVTTGDAVVILREKKPNVPLVEIGEGAVLGVQADTATIRITKARDAIRSGDRVAFVR
jgi:hypothetical protein